MVKNKFPMVLWLLPLFFGLIGGVVAALLASLVYKASWWELFVGGLIMHFLYLIGYLLCVGMLLGGC